MSKPRTLALAALMGLSLTAVSSYGDMFDYSLTLSGGDSVTGTLQGTWSDSSHTYVTGVSNVTLTIGGYQNLDSAGTWIVGTPVVSTVAIDNNFTFSGNTVNLSMGENTGSDYYVEAFYPPGQYGYATAGALALGKLGSLRTGRRYYGRRNGGSCRRPGSTTAPLGR